MRTKLGLLLLLLSLGSAASADEPPWLYTMEQARAFLSNGTRAQIMRSFLEVDVEGEAVWVRFRTRRPSPPRRLSKEEFRLCYKAFVFDEAQMLKSQQLLTWAASANPGETLVFSRAVGEGREIHSEACAVLCRGEDFLVGYGDFSAAAADREALESLAAPLDKAVNLWECLQNLKVLAEALKQFKKENGDYPEKLELLVPKYLSAERLYCPEVARPYYANENGHPGASTTLEDDAKLVLQYKSSSGLPGKPGRLGMPYSENYKKPSSSSIHLRCRNGLHPVRTTGPTYSTFRPPPPAPRRP